MPSPDMLNPFLLHRADDTVTIPPGHIPDLHADAWRACIAAVNQTAQVGQALGLVLIGEAGGGKSHLVAQLRQHLANAPRVAFAAVRMSNAFSGRLWRPLRSRLVEELLRPYPSPAHAANGLLRLLKNQFPAWASAAQTASGSLLDWQLGRRPLADLAPHLDAFQLETPLDADLAAVLPRIGEPATTALALGWLRGKQCGPEQLQRLGLSPQIGSEAEQEASAQEVVLSLARLAGRHTILVLCFDEVEAIQGGNWDTAALRSFATLLTALLGETGPRLVITSLRPTLYTEISKAVELSNVQKFAQLTARLAPLSRQQMDRVVQARLAAAPAVREAWTRRPSEPLWPFSEPFLASTFASAPRSLTPRALIVACHIEFERLKGNAAGPADGTAPPRVDPPSGVKQAAVSFNKAWENRRDLALKTPAALPFDHMMATGLPWLAGLTGVPLVASDDRPPGMGDVNLVFLSREKSHRPLWVSLCNQSPQQLWRRLDRLLAQWRQAKDRRHPSLVVLRSELERTTEGARQRLDDLRAAGVQVIAVPRQTLAEMAAFQGLMSSALTGDLVNSRGAPFTEKEYNAWAAQNLTGAVKEFLDQVFGPLKQPQTAAAAAAVSKAGA